MIELLIEPDPTYWQVFWIGTGITLFLTVVLVWVFWKYAESALVVPVLIAFPYLVFLGSHFTGTVNGEQDTAVKKSLPGELLSGDLRNPPFLVDTPTGVEQWTLDIDKKYLILLEKY